MPLLEVQNLSFGYEHELLFRNIGFQLNPGEILGK